MSSRALCPGSNHPRASEQAARWIPATSAGMTIAPPAQLLLHVLAGVDLDEIRAGRVLRALLAGGALLDEGDVAIDALHLDVPERLGDGLGLGLPSGLEPSDDDVDA